MSAFDERQSVLRERADLNARLSLIPYEGTPEIKEVSGQKYLYMKSLRVLLKSHRRTICHASMSFIPAFFLPKRFTCKEASGTDGH